MPQDREDAINEVRAGERFVQINANNGSYYVLDRHNRAWALSAAEINEFDPRDRPPGAKRYLIFGTKHD